MGVNYLTLLNSFLTKTSLSQAAQLSSSRSGLCNPPPLLYERPNKMLKPAQLFGDCFRKPTLLVLVLRVGWGQSPCSALPGGSSSPWFLLRKAVKATLVLLPLLGITYMLFFVNPGEDEISRVVFIYFNSFLESFQVWLSAPTAIPRPKGCGGAHGVADVLFHSSSIPKIDLGVASEMLNLGVTLL